ncbi:hypothetical protein AAMO2058_000372300 [Amorphochlora amoebiformis]
MRMLDIPVALLILCALLSSGAKGNCLGGECDVDDTYREPDPEAQSSESQMMLHVVNGEEDKIGVYWVGSGEKVLIVAIDPRESTNVNSYVNHQFEFRSMATGTLKRRHIVSEVMEDNHIFLGASKTESIEGVESLGSLEELGDEVFPKYVRYQHSRPVRTREIPMGAKFRSFYPNVLSYYFDDGTKQGQYNGDIKPMGRSAINTYATHKFILKKKGTNQEVARITMEHGKNFVILQPDDEKYMAKIRKTQFYKDVMDELKWVTEYQNRTGLPWLSYHPRQPPILPMWNADHIGQEHTVVVNPEETLTLKVISLRPRVLFIENVLNEKQIAHIMEFGRQRVKRSAVGNSGDGFFTDTRTSRTAWVRREESKTMEEIFQRFAKVLNLSDDRLQHDKNAESLQIVTYGPGQKYSPHHDFSDNGAPPQRFLTLFIYLKPAESEGGTGFPLAFDRRGMKVLPKAGSGVLWYNMLPDGNADEMSLHEGMVRIQMCLGVLCMGEW